MGESFLRYYENIVVIDVETTGFDFLNDEIIEIGAIRLNQEMEVVEVLSEFINIGRKLPDKIVEITGITDKDIEKGINRKTACEKFLKIIDRERTLLIAHNAHFDFSFLAEMAKKEGKKANNKVDKLDSMTVYKDRKPYPHKLSDAIISYGLSGKVKNNHRAIDDAYALLEVIKSMCKEENNINEYVNIFGYNPKYGVNGVRLKGIDYRPQPYNQKLIK